MEIGDRPKLSRHTPEITSHIDSSHRHIGSPGNIQEHPGLQNGIRKKHNVTTFTDDFPDLTGLGVVNDNTDIIVCAGPDNDPVVSGKGLCRCYGSSQIRICC